MLLKDKIILVFYIGVESLSKPKAAQYLASASNHFKGLADESAELIFLPDFETDTPHIDVINPRLLCDEDYCKVEELVDTCKKKLEEWEKETEK